MTTTKDPTWELERKFNESFINLLRAAEELVAEAPYAPKTHVAEAIKKAKRLVG
jgi:hypothetical protein